MAFLGFSSVALAQGSSAPAEEIIELEAFEITGIRASLTKGIDIKRTSYQSVDAIVAEDIGKFPDNNVVEALQRVSGVQVTNRGGGEVSTVTIRGLNDVTTTINGRNIFTSVGRSVALADIPASLLSRVDVFKTRAASQIETGIAGVIDVRTHRPFDFKGSKVVLAARFIHQEQADKTDPNLSALVSNVWELDSGKIGALLNVSFAETNYRDQSVTAGAMVPFMTANPLAGWVPYERIFLSNNRVLENPIWQPGLEAGLPFAAGSTLRMTPSGEGGTPQNVPYVLSRDAIFASDYTGTRKRPSVNVAFQWAPSDSAEYTFEAFYNGYRNDIFNNLLFSFADWWGALENDVVTLFPGTNIVKSRSSVGFPYGFMSGDLTTGKTDSYLYALAGKWDISDSFMLRADLSFQNSKYAETFLAMRTDRVHRAIAVDFNSGGGLPAFSFADDTGTANVDESDLTTPSLWTVAQLYDNGFTDKGDAATLSVDGEYRADWGIIKNLSFGVRYDDRGAISAQRVADEGFLGQNLSNFPDWVHVNKGFFDGRSDVPTTWAVADGHYLNAHADEIRTLYGMPLSNELELLETFDVNEATTSAYVQADFETRIGGRRLDGQFGLRFLSVDTDMVFTDLNTREAHSDSVSTTKVLPSFTLRYDIRDNLRARLSYGETLRRPGFGDLNPTINYVEDVTNIGYGTATGGNPDLKSTESKNYDLSLEYYFGEASALYGTAFRREIDGLVVGFRRRVSFEGYDYILSQPDNASDGVLKGFEFGVIYFPENLPDALKGLGFQASYTTLDSIQDIPITNDVGEIVGTDTTPFFAVSDKSYSVVLAYEKKRFGARLSYVWRDDFLNNYEAALFANPLGIYRRPEKSMDFQFTYNVSENFVVTFDVTNLTDEIFQSYYEYPETHNFGSTIFSRTFALGARYSF